MRKRIDWRKLGVVALTVSSVLAVAGVLYASGGGGGHGGEHVDSLSPAKIKDLIIRVVNFIPLVILLVWALRKPIANGLGGRRQAIKEQFEELDTQKAEAEKKYKEYESKLANLDAEVSSIIERAVAQAEAEKVRILEDAERAAGDIKRQAEMAIQHEIAEARKRLRDEVAEQAVALAEDIIRKNLQAADQTKLVEDYLEKVGAIQ